MDELVMKGLLAKIQECLADGGVPVEALALECSMKTLSDRYVDIRISMRLDKKGLA